MAIKRENIKTPIYTQATLGGRSEFEYSVEKGKLLLRFGRMVNFLEVKEDWVNDVKERIQKLKKEEQPKYKTQTSLYNKNKWDKCPNNRICPYVAGLIINQKYKL
jgi:hypothetical protein